MSANLSNSQPVRHLNPDHHSALLGFLRNDISLTSEASPCADRLLLSRFRQWADLDEGSTAAQTEMAQRADVLSSLSRSFGSEAVFSALLRDFDRRIAEGGQSRAIRNLARLMYYSFPELVSAELIKPALFAGEDCIWTRLFRSMVRSDPDNAGSVLVRLSPEGFEEGNALFNACLRIVPDLPLIPVFQFLAEQAVTNYASDDDSGYLDTDAECAAIVAIANIDQWPIEVATFNDSQLAYLHLKGSSEVSDYARQRLLTLAEEREIARDAIDVLLKPVQYNQDAGDQGQVGSLRQSSAVFLAVAVSADPQSEILSLSSCADSDLSKSLIESLLTSPVEVENGHDLVVSSLQHTLDSDDGWLLGTVFSSRHPAVRQFSRSVLAEIEIPTQVLEEWSDNTISGFPHSSRFRLHCFLTFASWSDYIEWARRPVELGAEDEPDFLQRNAVAFLEYSLCNPQMQRELCKHLERLEPGAIHTSAQRLVELSLHDPAVEIVTLSEQSAEVLEDILDQTIGRSQKLERCLQKLSDALEVWMNCEQEELAAESRVRNAFRALHKHKAAATSILTTAACRAMQFPQAKAEDRLELLFDLLFRADPPTWAEVLIQGAELETTRAYVRSLVVDDDVNRQLELMAACVEFEDTPQALRWKLQRVFNFTSAEDLQAALSEAADIVADPDITFGDHELLALCKYQELLLALAEDGSLNPDQSLAVVQQVRRHPLVMYIAVEAERIVLSRGGNLDDLGDPAARAKEPIARGLLSYEALFGETQSAAVITRRARVESAIQSLFEYRDPRFRRALKGGLQDGDPDVIARCFEFLESDDGRATCESVLDEIFSKATRRPDVIVPQLGMLITLSALKQGCYLTALERTLQMKPWSSQIFAQVDNWQYLGTSVFDSEVEWWERKRLPELTVRFDVPTLILWLSGKHLFGDQSISGADQSGPSAAESYNLAFSTASWLQVCVRSAEDCASMCEHLHRGLEETESTSARHFLRDILAVSGLAKFARLSATG